MDPMGYIVLPVCAAVVITFVWMGIKAFKSTNKTDKT